MKKALDFILRLMLLLVVLAEIKSIWLGVANKPKYVAVFPGADGALYYVTLLTSLAASVNAVFIWLKFRQAVWLNILIGVWSIILIEIMRGPRVNQAIVFVACATTTILPLALWRPSEANPG